MAVFHWLDVMPVASMTSALLAPLPMAASASSSIHGWQDQERFVNRLITEANQADLSTVPPELQPKLQEYLDKLRTSQAQIGKIAGDIRGHRREQARLDRKFAPTIAANAFVAQISDPAEKAKARELISEHGSAAGQQAYVDDVNARNSAAAAGTEQPSAVADTPGPTTQDYAVGDDEFDARANVVRDGDSITVHDAAAPAESEPDTAQSAADAAADAQQRAYDRQDSSETGIGGGATGSISQAQIQERTAEFFADREAKEKQEAAAAAKPAGTLIVPPRGDERGEGASAIVAVTEDPTPAAEKPANYGTGTAEGDTAALTPGQERVDAFRDAMSAHDASLAAPYVEVARTGLQELRERQSNIDAVARSHDDPDAKLYGDAVRNIQNPDSWKTDARGQELFEAKQKEIADKIAKGTSGFGAPPSQEFIDQKAAEATQAAWTKQWEAIADSPDLAAERVKSQNARESQLMRRWQESGEWPLKGSAPDPSLSPDNPQDVAVMKAAVGAEVAHSEGGAPAGFEDLDLAEAKKSIESGQLGEFAAAASRHPVVRAGEFAGGVLLGAGSAVALAPEYQREQDLARTDAILRGEGGSFSPQSFPAFVGSKADPRQYNLGDLAQETLPVASQIDAISDFKYVDSPISKGLMAADAVGLPLPLKVRRPNVGPTISSLTEKLKHGADPLTDAEIATLSRHHSGQATLDHRSVPRATGGSFTTTGSPAQTYLTQPEIEAINRGETEVNRAPAFVQKLAKNPKVAGALITVAAAPSLFTPATPHIAPPASYTTEQTTAGTQPSIWTPRTGEATTSTQATPLTPEIGVGQAASSQAQPSTVQVAPETAAPAQVSSSTIVNAQAGTEFEIPAPAVQGAAEAAESQTASPTAPQPVDIAVPDVVEVQQSAPTAIAEPDRADVALAVPAPVNVPAPIDVPAPVPAPIDVPAPVPAPIDVPAPVPAPIDVPAPVPAPIDVPAPVPAPIDVPAPVPAPIDVPAPVPAPIDVPAPVPAPIDVPAPVPAPIDVPAPVPAPIDVPAPVQAPAELPVPARVEIGEPTEVPDVQQVPLKTQAQVQAQVPSELPVTQQAASTLPAPEDVVANEKTRARARVRLPSQDESVQDDPIEPAPRPPGTFPRAISHRERIEASYDPETGQYSARLVESSDPVVTQWDESAPERDERDVGSWTVTPSRDDVQANGSGRVTIPDNMRAALKRKAEETGETASSTAALTYTHDLDTRSTRVARKRPPANVMVQRALAANGGKQAGALSPKYQRALDRILERQENKAKNNRKGRRRGRRRNDSVKQGPVVLPTVQVRYVESPTGVRGSGL